jgi:DNA-binding NarL/FixJ family response regulator
LIVDSHPAVRRAIKQTLDSYPEIAVVAEASNGEDAVKQAERTHPDVVLIDIHLLSLNGIETTRTIKRLLPNTAILGLSAAYTPSLYNAMIAAGAVAFIRKEDVPALLFKTLVYTLSTYRPYQDSETAGKVDALA